MNARSQASRERDFPTLRGVIRVVNVESDAPPTTAAGSHQVYSTAKSLELQKTNGKAGCIACELSAACQYSRNSNAPPGLPGFLSPIGHNSKDSPR
ncbi:hypothetical protein J6590_026964 [Homalodisca vitripennis]|nr:hypothetical protein J6590_026964 [Homalodisca vitripennis]